MAIRKVRACILASLCLLIFAGCAKTGDPHPPEVLIPKPPTDLTARQDGDRALLSVSMPSENTNGSPVTTLARVDFFRLMDENREKISPLAEDEFIKRAERLFSIPAEKLSAYVVDGRLALHDPFDIPDHTLICSRGFRYAARFVNNKRQSAGLTNQAFLAPVPIPPPPKGLSYEIAQDHIRIRWDPPSENMDGSKPPRIAGYRVYRADDAQRSARVPLNKEPLATPEFADRDFQFDATYYYEVSVVGSRENPYAESPPSAPLKVIVRDIFPPGAPRNLNAVVERGTIILLWAPAADPDVAGYRVYRREEGAAEAHLLRQSLVTGLSYTDTAVQSARKYVYSVTAVDSHGNEGPPAQAAVEVR